MSADQNDAGYERLAEIAARLKRGQTVEVVTLSELLRWFGARRRNLPTNRQIRAALFKNDLQIAPDLHEGFLDGEIEFHQGNLERKRAETSTRNLLTSELRTVRVAAWIDQNPGVTEYQVRAKAAEFEEMEISELLSEEAAGTIPLYEWLVLGIRPIDEALAGPENLAEIAQKLRVGELVEPVTVRELLGWFGANHRSSYSNYQIRESLRTNGLQTEPDWNKTYLDTFIKFHEGYKPTDVEIRIFNEDFLQLLLDRLVTWIDQNPQATMNEIKVKAAELHELGIEEHPRDQGAQIIPLFPEQNNERLFIGEFGDSEKHRTTSPELPVATAAPCHFTIFDGETGHTYDTIFGDYIAEAQVVTIEESYIRNRHQRENFRRFCEMVVRRGRPTVRQIKLITGDNSESDQKTTLKSLNNLKKSLLEHNICLDIQFNTKMHDREVRIDSDNNGWIIKIGRGLDFYYPPVSWYSADASDFALRQCRETKVDIFQTS